ncbi:MAG: hypothetical protein LUE29_13835 [Lachnospiraceae bacterium]|nr:hypothetical protein [Lachnospiraceae bacterium]
MRNKMNFSIIRYHRKRNREQFRFSRLLPFALMFFLLMAAFAIQDNFESFYIETAIGDYPVDTFNIYDEELEKFEKRDQVELWDYYVVDGGQITLNAGKANQVAEAGQAGKTDQAENTNQAEETNQADVTEMIGVYLAGEEDSVLAIDGMIEFGSFPKDTTEVLVTRELIQTQIRSSESTLYDGTTSSIEGSSNESADESLILPGAKSTDESLILPGAKSTDESLILPDANSSEESISESDLLACLGTTVTIGDREFTISGILYALDETQRSAGACSRFESYFMSDIYYQWLDTDQIIFIPYQSITEIGVKRETTVHRGVYRGLFEDLNVVSALRAAMYNGNINLIDQDICQAQKSLESVMRILEAVFGVFFFMACIFLCSQIRIELFYHRKELGYLQIFGLGKPRIWEIYTAGYVLKFVASFVLGILIYVAAAASSGVLFMLWQGNTEMSRIFSWGGSGELPLLLGMISVFYLGCVAITVWRYLRRDVIQLIR